MLKWRCTFTLCVLAALLAGACFAPAARAAVAAGSAPTTTAARPAITAPLSGDALAEELDQRFGIWFVGGGLPKGLEVQLPADATAKEALRKVADASAGSSEKPALREVAGSEGKVWQVVAAGTNPPPAAFGSDPAKVAISDDLVMQIIPLTNLSARSLADDLAPFMDPSTIRAVESHNCIVGTGTSAKVHRLMEIVGKLGQDNRGKTSMDYRQLKYANAAEVAQTINQRFGKPALTAPATATATGPARLDFTRLYVDSDARTNTVVLNGPAELIKQALEMIDQLDAAPATVPAGGGAGGGR